MTCDANSNAEFCFRSDEIAFKTANSTQLHQVSASLRNITPQTFDSANGKLYVPKLKFNRMYQGKALNILNQKLNSLRK